LSVRTLDSFQDSPYVPVGSWHSIVQSAKPL
jgi:hypothetical protein